MSGLEDSVLRNINRYEAENRNRFVNKHIGNKTTDADISTRFNNLKKAGWGEVWNDAKLRHVARSEQFYGENFSTGEDAKNAQVLESLISYGVNTLYWFGNQPFKAASGKTVVPFYTLCRPNREFDDKRHRADATTTFRISPTDKEKYQLKSDEISFALDVTTWQEDKRTSDDASRAKAYFREKISRTNNEKIEYQAPAPFGFTQVDFFIDPFRRDEKGEYIKKKLPLAPRFVVAVNGGIVDAIREHDFTINDRGGYEPKPGVVLHDPRSLTTSFKILSELSAEVDLLLAMFPATDALPDTLQDSYNQLTAMKGLTSFGLRKVSPNVAKVLTEKKLVKGDVAEQLASAKPREQAEILSSVFRDSENSTNDLQYDPAYDGLMDTIEDLRKFADTPDAERVKSLQARDKSI